MQNTPLAALSDRELSVLALIASGASNESIAQQLHISVKTLEAACRSIFRKLDLPDARDANRRVRAAVLYVEHAPRPLPRSGLPSRRASFIGRRSELLELEEQLRRHRVVTVVGSGGSGKTSLAIALAAQRVDHEEVVRYLDLVPRRDRAGVLSGLYDTFAVVADAWNVGRRRVMSALGSEPTLLVIDNAEQVAEATAWLVEQLTGAPNLEILITSRIPLGLPGEHLWAVPPLVPAASRQLLQERLSVPLTDDQTALVVNAADGLPLAVELLASSLNAVGPAAVSSRLDQLPALLRRSGGDRHASIGAAIDASYRALPADDQRVFRQMSVFPGGFTAATAEHVTDGEVDAPIALARLVAASLLPRAEGDRFRMLEPIRQFAEEQLAIEEEGDDAIARMIAWVRQFTRTMSKRAFDQRHPDWRRTTAAELAVIDRAFDEAASRGDVESAQAIAAAMCPFHQSTNAAAGYRRALAALALSERDTRSTAALLLGAGQLAVAFSRDDAIRLLDDARRRLEHQGRATGVATAWHYRAVATRDLTDCEYAVAAADVCGLVALRGHTRINHAISLAIHGCDPDLSLRGYDEAERIGREHGSDHVIANSKKARASLLLGKGAPAEQVLPLLEWAERVSAAEGDQWVLFDCHAFTAELLIRDGEFEEALVPVEACLTMTVNTLDDATAVPWGLLLAAALLRHRGDVDAANAAAHAAAGHPYGVERSLELAVTPLQARELAAAGPAPRIDLDLADLHEAAAAALEALRRPTR